MSLTRVPENPDWLVRLEGRITLTAAPELQTLLVDGLVSGKPMELDLSRVTEIDITALQLLWSARREAAAKGVRMMCQLSEAAAATVREAGFKVIDVGGQGGDE